MFPRPQYSLTGDLDREKQGFYHHFLECFYSICETPALKHQGLFQDIRDYSSTLFLFGTPQRHSYNTQTLEWFGKIPEGILGIL